MEKKITIPATLYQKLYKEIMNYGFEPYDEDDNSCYMDEIIIDDFRVNLRATFETCIDDKSFDHAFGTEIIIDVVAGGLEDIEDVEVWYYDEEGNEYDLSEQFDYEYFWSAARANFSSQC